MAHAQEPDFVFRRNGRVHLNRRGHQFSRLLAVEVCASAVVMLDTPCSDVVWRVLATHSIRQFPLHFPSRASPCAITFQLESTNKGRPCSAVSLYELRYGKVHYVTHTAQYPYSRYKNCTVVTKNSHVQAYPDIGSLQKYNKWTLIPGDTQAVRPSEIPV